MPDDRFDWLCDFYKPASRVPAYLQITDIAGLVKGASDNQGLGNAVGYIITHNFSLLKYFILAVYYIHIHTHTLKNERESFV